MTTPFDPSTILITGANSGIGLAAARLVALKDSTTKVILGCRDEAKARGAKEQLEKATGKDVFEVLLVDLMDLQSVRDAAASLDGTVDCLILNAGGPGGRDYMAPTKDGIAGIMALNVVGNALLVNELLTRNKLSSEATVVYSSSEGARGVPELGFPTPNIESGSVDEFKSALDGTKFATKKDRAFENAYAWAKCMGVLWTSAMARKHPARTFVSVSPGMTTGTNVLNDLGYFQRTLLTVLTPFLRLFGVGHGVDTGAGRYLGPVYEPEGYESGVFYGSKQGKFTGELVPQTDMFEDLGKEAYQDNVHKAIQGFM